MPLIQVDMFEGRTAEIKREFVETITRETCRVLVRARRDANHPARREKIRLGLGRSALVGKKEVRPQLERFSAARRAR